LGVALFTIRYIESAKEKYFSEIPLDKKHLIKRVIEERLTTKPQDFGKPLRGSLKKHYRLRVGDYRIIYRIDLDVKIVTVIAIGHRKDIYEDYQ
jgi:mRNA interferase RelE/StbE